MKENFKIVPSPFLRDVKTERRIIDYNRERLALYLILVGAVMMIIAIIW